MLGECDCLALLQWIEELAQKWGPRDESGVIIFPSDVSVCETLNKCLRLNKVFKQPL